jgi:DNA replication protein DnaC
MRLEKDVQEFADQAAAKYEKDEARASYYTACYQACIPKSFWDVKGTDVRRNKKAFKMVILTYIKKWRVALRNGYGLILCGDNGTGKTLFLSFILTQMIKRDCSAYYTSVAQLDVDIKSSFNDNERARRLDRLLDCDFLAIDEMGKEHVKDNSYLRSRLELLLKTRFDNGDPTLIASNLDLESLESHYGSSITSMFRGKFNFVPLICPDYREQATELMKERMGFK